MTVTIKRVYRLLGKHLENDIPPDVVYEYLGFATDMVNQEASEEATTAQKERAILALTALYSFIRYTSSKHISTGGKYLPEGLEAQKKYLEEMAERAMAIVKRSSSVVGAIGVVGGLTKTMEG